MPENQQHQQADPAKPGPQPAPSHTDPPPFQPDPDLIVFIAKSDKPAAAPETPLSNVSPPEPSGGRD